MICSLNSLERFKFLRSGPVFNQFGTMSRTPFFDYGRSLARQLPFRHFTVFNIYQSHKALVFDMDMRWRMIVMPHPDDDAKENREYGARRDCADYSGDTIFLETPRRATIQ